VWHEGRRRAGCACACRPHGRGAHAAAAERRSKRPARSGPTRVRGEAGCMRGSAAPLDRREEMPTRKVASAPEAPVTARAATGRQRRARREAPPEWP